MKIDKHIFKSLALINQIGISMLVPIFLSVYIGNKLDKWLLTNYLTIVFLFLGIFAAFRNVYYLTKSFYTKEKMRDSKLHINNTKYSLFTKEKNERKDKAEDEFNKWAKEQQRNSKS